MRSPKDVPRTARPLIEPPTFALPLRRAKGRSETIFRRCDEAPFRFGRLKRGKTPPDGQGFPATGRHIGGGGGARISRLPAWLGAPTTPSFSIRSIKDAARL